MHMALSNSAVIGNTSGASLKMTLFKFAQASRAFKKSKRKNGVCTVTKLQLAQIKKDCHISSRHERAISDQCKETFTSNSVLDVSVGNVNLNFLFSIY